LYTTIPANNFNFKNSYQFMGKFLIFRAYSRDYESYNKIVSLYPLSAISENTLYIIMFSPNCLNTSHRERTLFIWRRRNHGGHRTYALFSANPLKGVVGFLLKISDASYEIQKFNFRILNMVQKYYVWVIWAVGMSNCTIYQQLIINYKYPI